MIGDSHEVGAAGSNFKIIIVIAEIPPRFRNLKGCIQNKK
jgi:hypothetical protein